MRGSIDEKLHEIFTEKSDASNLAIDGKLFTEPAQDVDMESILAETIQAFSMNVDTVDEQTLILQWEATSARQLRHAGLQFQEHSKIKTDITDAEAAAAVAAMQIPSPTQLTVDICRKKFQEGTYKKTTSKQVKALTAKLKAANKKKK
jgi:hypothetical protein